MVKEVVRKAPVYTHIPLFKGSENVGNHGFSQQKGNTELPIFISTQAQDTLAQIQHCPEIINNRPLRKRISEVEETTLPATIQGFYEGIALALEHFSWETHPKITTPFRNYAEKEVTSIPVEYDAQDDTIIVYILPLLTFCISIDYIQEVLHRKRVYMGNEQALMNIYKRFGIHEAIHFLQAHHAGGLHHIYKETVAANFIEDPDGYTQDVFEIEAFAYADMLAGKRDPVDVMKLVEEYQAARNNRQTS